MLKRKVIIPIKLFWFAFLILINLGVVCAILSESSVQYDSNIIDNFNLVDDEFCAKEE